MIEILDLTNEEVQITSSFSSSSSSSSSSIFSSATIGDNSSISSVDLSPKIIDFKHLNQPINESTNESININGRLSSPKQLSFSPSPKSSPDSFLKHENNKTVFVEALVGSAVLLIDAIWKNNNNCPMSKKSMPLRRFIQETLKRSRTSYSTFQVSLYYLILVKPFIFEQLNENRLSKSPLSCSRRTFLASLMLASKCLQDRNYSINAWSKISGLSVKELGNNEIEFLKAANWKLHVSQETYNRWSTLLLYSASVKPETWKNKIRNIGSDISLDESNQWDIIDLTKDNENELSLPSSTTTTTTCSSQSSHQPGYYMTNKDEWRFIRSSLQIQKQNKPTLPKRTLEDEIEILNVRPVKRRRSVPQVILVDGI